MFPLFTDCNIHPSVLGSDHCPVSCDLQIDAIPEKLFNIQFVFPGNKEKRIQEGAKSVDVKLMQQTSVLNIIIFRLNHSLQNQKEKEYWMWKKN